MRCFYTTLTNLQHSHFAGRLFNFTFVRFSLSFVQIHGWDHRISRIVALSSCPHLFDFPPMEFSQRAQQFANRVAISDQEKSYTYQDILDRSAKIAATLLGEANDLNEAPVCFLLAPGFDYVATQWGIWRAGGIAVPMGLSHPVPELQYILEMTKTTTLVCGTDFQEKALKASAGFPVNVLAIDVCTATPKKLPNIDSERKAMILFTSGTTSRPKGVVAAHANINHQVKCLVDAWEWSANDVILNVLPLHHTHGIINVVCCALWCGARVEFAGKMDAAALWRRFQRRGLTLFMAVPTIYSKLLGYWDDQSEAWQSIMAPTLNQFRLMVSGSAALPVSVLERVSAMSGQVLLERYGMTEIGMALSNPYAGERRAGTVGQPLPGVSIKLVDEQLQPVAEGSQGEIMVKGPTVFNAYWENPKASAEAFIDGWFRTGDIAVLQDGYYRILGRDSVDIIKTGGYKVSALEIEEVLRQNPAVQDCAVVGIADSEWGEVVSALIVPSEEKFKDSVLLQNFLKEQLASYKVARTILFAAELPRNVLGKVLKTEVKKLFIGQ
jgi:malonyl-CoA/methylmalonyl-CoA synthetase